jgi:hypothetical protein
LHKYVEFEHVSGTSLYFVIIYFKKIIKEFIKI